MFNFFRRIQSVLTADTTLEICYYIPSYGGDYIDPKDIADQVNVGNARLILGHLLPLIDGVQAVYTDDRMLPLVKSCMREKFNQIKMLHVSLYRPVQSAMKPTVEWLASNNNNNEPKLLQLFAKNSIAKRVLDAVRKVLFK